MAKKQQIVEYLLADAAKELGCSKSSVERRVRELKLGRKVGFVRLITAAELEQIRETLKPSAGNPNWKKRED